MSVARIKNRIIEPSDSPSGEIEAINLFRKAGWELEDARWLGPLCWTVLRDNSKPEADLDEVSELGLSVVASSWIEPKFGPHRDRALLVAFSRLIGCGGTAARLPHPRPKSTPTEIATIAHTFKSHGANFSAALISTGWPGEYGSDNDLHGELVMFVREGRHSRYQPPEILRLMQVLVDCAGVDLAAVVNQDALAAAGVRRSMPDPAMRRRVPESIDGKLPTIADPRALTNWMIALGPRALTLAFPDLRKIRNDAALVALVVGVQDAIERWMICRTMHWTHFRFAGKDLSTACAPFLEELGNRCREKGDAVLPQLRNSWLWFAWCAYESDPGRWEKLSVKEQEQILAAATHDIGKMRALLGRAKPRPTASGLSGQAFGHQALEPWEEFEWEKGHFESCVMLLYEFGGVWRGMKPLLLALRAFTSPCIARDLRYWQDTSLHSQSPVIDELAQPPEPWASVPRAMVNLFHAFVGEEQSSDKELTRLRGEFASFCLERLTDRWKKAERESAEKTGRSRENSDMMEPSPEWRLCLIRAAASLYINPGGNSHRILKKSAEIDPDEEVREAAREAYEQFRRFKGVPENVSPRRMVMSAIWWLRQAHLLGLGIQPDADGAQRTRTKELTRTKEAERGDNPAAKTM